MTQQAVSRMADEAQSLAQSPLAALRKRWWLALVLCPIGAAAGAGVASLGTTHYTAETRLAVGDGSLTNAAVPGYALASQELAESYARWVNNTSAVEEDSAVQITSSPIPQSSIVRIEATAENQQDAIQAAKAKGEDLIERVNAAKPGNDPEEVLTQFEDYARQVAAIEAQVEAASSRVGATRNTGGQPYQTALTQLENARTQRSILEIQRDALGQRYRDIVSDETAAAELNVIRAADITKNDASARLQRYGLLGFVMGGLLALFLATWLERRSVANEPARGSSGRSGGRPATTPEPPRPTVGAARSATGRNARQVGGERWKRADRDRDAAQADAEASATSPVAPARPAGPHKSLASPSNASSARDGALPGGPARTDRVPTAGAPTGRSRARGLSVRSRPNSSSGA